MRGTASAGAMARLLTVCAVLPGLFLMHGLPAQACPAGTAMPAAAMSATGHAEHPALAVHARSGQAIAVPAPAVHGTPCVFTPASRGIDVLMALLLLLAAAVASVLPPRVALGGIRCPRSHRAPPRAGAQLLTTLCVSRT